MSFDVLGMHFRQAKASQFRQYRDGLLTPNCVRIRILPAATTLIRAVFEKMPTECRMRGRYARVLLYKRDCFLRDVVMGTGGKEKDCIQ